MSHLKIICVFLRYAGNHYPLMRGYIPKERIPQPHSGESLMIRITVPSNEQYCPCFIMADINTEDRCGAPTGSVSIISQQWRLTVHAPKGRQKYLWQTGREYLAANEVFYIMATVIHSQPFLSIQITSRYVRSVLLQLIQLLSTVFQELSETKACKHFLFPLIRRLSAACRRGDAGNIRIPSTARNDVTQEMGGVDVGREGQLKQFETLQWTHCLAD
jgi:hypothetical protein